MLAFLAFADAGVDIAVLETGLGGRLDAVTTCRAPAPPRSPRSGSTTPATSATPCRRSRGEKAGILKPGVPCFLGRLPAEADAEIDRVAAKRRCAAATPRSRLRRADRRRPAWPGPHQRANAAIAARARARRRCATSAVRLDDAAVVRAVSPMSAGRAASRRSATICCSTRPTTRSRRARSPRRSRRGRPAAARCWSCRS